MRKTLNALALPLAAGILIAAIPIAPRPGLLGLEPSYAQAKDGRGGGDDHGGGGRDDHGGRGRGGDDRGKDDRGGGRGGDDRGGRGGRRADDRPGEDRGDDNGGLRAADGSREEIEDGWYERKDATGRTVEERVATRADIARLNGTRPGKVIAVGHVVSAEAAGGALEILYSSGWKEEVAAGRYELRDPDDNTVIERPARPADAARLREIAGARP